MNQPNSATRLRVAVLCGGRSGEHEISLLSARSIAGALAGDRYDVTLVGIARDGQWRLQPNLQYLLDQSDPRTIHLDPSGPPVTLSMDPERPGLLALAGAPSVLPDDVVFPVLHGPYGEDGTVQGLLEICQLPYVGAGVLGSAVGMDKDIMKRLLRDAGIPTPDFLVVYQRRWLQDAPKIQEAVWERFAPPVFVKPANLGSSVGVTKVKTRQELPGAIGEALRFDAKVIVEEFIQGREIECSVLGNDDPVASAPGEVIPTHEFYSYEAKYIDERGADLKIPADLPPAAVEQVRKLAVATYRALACEGMGRVDFFYASDGRLLVIEINTIPGFTRISMYPKLWEVSGIPFATLLDRLIELALTRHERRRRLKVEPE